jgi:low affinity Fe/Cu permease
MAKARSKPKIVAENAQPAPKLASKAVGAKKTAHDVKENLWAERFSAMACVIAHWMGKPIAFLIALAAVLVWAATGPLFGYSDTWQLVINTSTTIVTFLMVFLIQNTQNRDTMALQVKLAELIIAMRGAQNRLATAEDLSEEELEELHKEYCGRAEALSDTLQQRRGKKRG